jgi:drug/metabolite transporter (DMT)-like permease
MGVVLFSLLAAAAFAWGNVLQRRAFVRIARFGAPQGAWGWARTVLVEPSWALGMLLSSVGALLQYYAMAQWNLSVVQPILSANPLMTTVLGWWMLDEKADRRTLLALALCVAGIFLMGWVGPEAKGHTGTLFWPFVLVLAVSMAVLHFAPLGSAEMRYALSAGVGFGLSSILYKGVVAFWHFEEGLRVALGTLVVRPEAWAYVVAYTAAFFASQVALARGRALVVVPFSAAVGSALPALAGILVFGEPVGLLKGTALALVFLASALFLPWHRLRNRR